MNEEAKGILRLLGQQCSGDLTIQHAEDFHLNLYLVQVARYVSKHGKTSSRGKSTLLNQGRYVCGLPVGALSTFILRQLLHPLWPPHPPRNVSSTCRPRHAERNDSIAPE